MTMYTVSHFLHAGPFVRHNPKPHLRMQVWVILAWS